MSYVIEWSAQSQKRIRNLSSHDAERILRKLDDVAINPFRYLEHFEGNNLFKLRIGGYRLLIDVDSDKNVLYIQVLDKRSRVYKR